MPITSQWHIEKRVIHIQIAKTMTNADMLASSEKLKALIEEGEAPVHLIVEIIDLDETRVKVHAAIDAASYLNRAKTGTVVIVGVTVVVNFLLSVIETVYSRRFQRAESVEAALDLLRGLDDSLPD